VIDPIGARVVVPWQCLALISQQESLETKRHCIGVLFNLSFEHAEAILQNRAAEVRNIRNLAVMFPSEVIRIRRGRRGPPSYHTCSR
jgi:hypothetical protein